VLLHFAGGICDGVVAVDVDVVVHGDLVIGSRGIDAIRSVHKAIAICGAAGGGVIRIGVAHLGRGNLLVRRHSHHARLAD